VAAVGAASDGVGRAVLCAAGRGAGRGRARPAPRRPRRRLSQRRSALAPRRRQIPQLGLRYALFLSHLSSLKPCCSLRVFFSCVAALRSRCWRTRSAVSRHHHHHRARCRLWRSLRGLNVLSVESFCCNAQTVQKVGRPRDAQDTPVQAALHTAGAAALATIFSSPFNYVRSIQLRSFVLSCLVCCLSMCVYVCCCAVGGKVLVGWLVGWLALTRGRKVRASDGDGAAAAHWHAAGAAVAQRAAAAQSCALSRPAPSHRMGHRSRRRVHGHGVCACVFVCLFVLISKDNQGSICVC
jgi:hypothetical protein